MTAPGRVRSSDRSDPRHVVREGLAGADLAAVLRWAVAHAVLAPSELNSQPWAFEVDVDLDGSGGTVRVLVDRARRLEQVDPDDREAVLACGAALLNLRLALIGAELLPEVALRPDPAEPDLMAVVDVRRPTRERPEQLRLRSAVPHRTTYRGRFDPVPLGADVAGRLVAVAEQEGAQCRGITGDERPGIAALVLAGQHALWQRQLAREESAAWTRTNTSSSRDGVPGYAFGHGLARALLDPALQRRAALAPWSAAEQAEAAATAPVLLAIGSADDSPECPLRAGAGMQRVLLAIEGEGLAASFVNAPLHDEEHRARLSGLVGQPCPQVLVRAGRGPHAAPTPRRPIGEVLTMGRGRRP